MPDDPTHGMTRRDVLKAGAAVAGAGGVVGITETQLTYAQETGDAVTVTIRRDEYGVPHVYARDGDSRAPVYYGFGYVTASDRLFQLEMYRRYYHGTVAEVLGAGEESRWVQFDRESRRNTAGEPSLEQQAEEQLTESQRNVLEAYTEGINTYIREVRADDEREFHSGFQENDFEPEEFTLEDVAGVFVAPNGFFMGFQLETLGATVVDALTGRYGNRETALDVFSDANWEDDPGAPTATVQSGEGYWPPYTDPETGETTTYRPRERIDSGEQNLVTNRMAGGDVTVPQNSQQVHEREMERRQTIEEGLQYLGIAYKTGSFALAVNGDLTESGDALLMGGPQMDFSSPSVMYEIGLHGPDFDVAGTTVAGYPCVMFGHNNHGAFTSTAGIDNLVQTFEVDVEINEDGPDTYEFQGETEEIEEVEQTIEVDGGENETYTERFTRHGVVTQWNPDAGQAIVKTLSYAGRHMTCFRGYYEIQFAEDVGAFSEAGRQCDYAVNLLWADQNGDIGYFHLGRYVDFETVEWDTRFPADGNQYELTEDDYRRAADGETPYSINPPAGYSASWNCKHAPGWHAGDLNYNYSTDHRVQRIINRVERELHTSGELNYEFLKTIPRDLAFIDLRSIRYKEHLLDALGDADLDETEQAAKAQLEAWGHMAQGDGSDSMGTYPPGYTIWNEAFGNILSEVYGPVFGEALGLGLFFHNNNYGRGALMRLLNPEETALALSEHADYGGGDPEGALVRAFRTAVETLDEEFEGEPADWREQAAVDSLSTVSLFGVPVGNASAGEMAQMNRGTEEHFVRLGEEIHAENVLPPGNDGYIAPDGSTGPHFDDQLELFKNFEYKPLRLSDDDIEAATESTEELSFKIDEDGTGDDGTGDGNGTGDDDGTGDDETGDDGTGDNKETGDDGTADDGTDGDSADDDGPGFGVGTTIAALSGTGYLLKRKLTDDGNETE